MTTASAQTESDQDALGVPPFRLLFPEGWRRYGVTVEDERELLALSREKFKAMHRPDLDLQVTAQVKGVFRQLRGTGAFAVFLPTEVSEDMIVPMSMTAAVLTDPAGRTLDGRIAELFREEGAEFLGEDHTIVRWVRAVRRQPQLPDAAGTQLNYVIPVPGTARRSALLLSTALLDDGAGTVGVELREILIGLSDTVVGTFTWDPSVGRAPRGGADDA